MAKSPVVAFLLLVMTVSFSPSHVKLATSYDCFTGCDYISIWDRVNQSCGPFLLNQIATPTYECYSTCEALSSGRLSRACNGCPPYVHDHFNMTRFLELANAINPRFGTPLCCECDGIPGSASALAGNWSVTVCGSVPHLASSYVSQDQMRSVQVIRRRAVYGHKAE